MDDEVRREKDQDEFEKERSERDAKDDEKTRKNREKREKMKARKSKKGKGGGGGNGGAPTTTNGNARPANGTEGTTKKIVKEEITTPSTQEKPESAKPAAEGGIIFHDEDD